MECQLSYFKLQRMMLLKCFIQYASKFGKLSSVYRLEKVSFHSNPKEDQCQRIFKLLHNCIHFTCQQGNAQNPEQARLHQYVNQELQDVQAGFRKDGGSRDQVANIH